MGPTNEQGDLKSISIPSSKVIYSCGSNGRILKSTDAGSYWISLKTLSDKPLNSIYFFNDNNGFAVGDSGIISHTSSGGISPTNNRPSPFHLSGPLDGDTISIQRSISPVDL